MRSRHFSAKAVLASRFIKVEHEERGTKALWAKVKGKFKKND